MKSKFYIYLLTLTVSICNHCFCQTDYFPSSKWLEDDLTIPLNKTKGIRLVYEPQFGFIYSSATNKIKNEDLLKTTKFGIEFNLYKAWISIQPYIVFPSTVGYDDKSEILTLNVLKTGNEKTSINIGYGIGASFFNGMIGLGYGSLKFDKRDYDISSQNYKSSLLNYSFWYFNIQPVSLIRNTIIAIKKTKKAKANDQNAKNMFFR